MDDKEKVYEQEIVAYSPFPGGDIPITTTQANPTGVYTPTVSKDKSVPRKKIATELLSTALNTRSKKILQEFQLEQSGGIQIGDFKEGITGDLRLTPNGLTARDLAGVTTFAIDGTTGDATFKGEVQAGSLISGSVVVGDNTIVINGGTKQMIWYADDGLPAIVIGEV